MLQLKFMNRKLLYPMACYVVLALLAGFTLTGLFRAAVWVFLAGLAAKTWIHVKMRRED